MDNIPRGVDTEVVLYQVDTVDELHRGRVVHTDTDQGDTSPRMLQDKGFVLGKVTVLDTVLTRGSHLVGEPFQGNPQVEDQHQGELLLVEEIQAASRSGGGS